MKTATTTTARTYTTRTAAFEAAAAFVGVELEADPSASARAGYPVMRSADGAAWVSDLGARFEANRADGETVNFWIDADPAESETRTETATRTRRAYEAARETETRAASALRRIEAETVDAVRALRAADLDRLAESIESARETAAETAAPVAALRAAYLAARSNLRAADLLDYMESDPRALLDLAAASVSRAIDRREAESATDGRALRMRYAATRPTLSETMEADAVQEAAADLLAAVMGDPDRPDRPAWIDGETEDGAPRAALPLAYVAARSAGRALDRIMYADGGRAVKLSAREAREAYRNAADLAPLADRADLLREEAESDPTPERKAAAREARAEYLAAARRFAASAVVVETRRTSDPVAPSPEAAAIEAERVERVLAAVAPALRRNAAAVVVAVYEGAETIREAARAAGLPEATARRAWHAVRNAAALILAEDGETRDLERLIASDERTRAAMGRRREDATEARRAVDLADRAAATESDPAPETAAAWRETARAARPARLSETARLSPSDLAAVRDLARRLFHGLAD